MQAAWKPVPGCVIIRQLACAQERISGERTKDLPPQAPRRTVRCENGPACFLALACHECALCKCGTRITSLSSRVVSAACAAGTSLNICKNPVAVCGRGRGAEGAEGGGGGGAEGA